MNEQTLAVVEKLADKLGVTAEYLWGVLLKQAPISATMDLLICIAVVIAAVWVVRSVGPREREDLLEAEEILTRIVAGFVCFFAFLLVTINANDIIAGLFNPEYWALKQIMR